MEIHSSGPNYSQERSCLSLCKGKHQSNGRKNFAKYVTSMIHAQRVPFACKACAFISFSIRKYVLHIKAKHVHKKSISLDKPCFLHPVTVSSKELNFVPPKLELVSSASSEEHHSFSMKISPVTAEFALNALHQVPNPLTSVEGGNPGGPHQNKTNCQSAVIPHDTNAMQVPMGDLLSEKLHYNPTHGKKQLSSFGCDINQRNHEINDTRAYSNMTLISNGAAEAQFTPAQVSLKPDLTTFSNIPETSTSEYIPGLMEGSLQNQTLNFDFTSNRNKDLIDNESANDKHASGTAQQLHVPLFADHLTDTSSLPENIRLKAIPTKCSSYEDKTSISVENRKTNILPNTDKSSLFNSAKETTVDVPVKLDVLNLDKLLCSNLVTMPNADILKTIDQNPKTWSTLQASFSKFPYPPREQINYLSRKTGLTLKQVKTWFVGARLKHGISWNPNEVVEAWSHITKPTWKKEDC
ncbi:unnamed protein product [Clavelina lepadiformis]|uniref:Homeobox domain-containing protein n=1 Tax=Clavelina lepadiformis TaxID=159417 RepID=A0ABP0G346_CLALP